MSIFKGAASFTAGELVSAMRGYEDLQRKADEPYQKAIISAKSRLIPAKTFLGFIYEKATTSYDVIWSDTGWCNSYWDLAEGLYLNEYITKSELTTYRSWGTNGSWNSTYIEIRELAGSSGDRGAFLNPTQAKFVRVCGGIK